MKAPLYKITVICLNSDKEKAAGIILNSGKVHVEKTDSITAKDGYPNLKEMMRCDEALEILNKYVPEKKSLFPASKPYAPVADKVNNKSGLILSLKDKISGHSERIAKNNERIHSLLPFKDFDLPLGNHSYQTVKYGIFTIERKITKEFLNQVFSDIYTEIIFSYKEKSAVFFIFPKENEKEFNEKLRENSFSELKLSTVNSPHNEIRFLINENKLLKKEIQVCEEKLTALSKERENIKLISDTSCIKHEMNEAITSGQQTDTLFILEGYTAKKGASELKNELESACICHVELTEPERNETLPVLFDNNIFTSPVEGITKTYALPGKHDIDPNSIMSVFYYIFFGMMFSDAGYGLLVAAFCGYMAFFSKADRKTKNTMRLFFFCGISTFFWGLMFGSFFGDATAVISKTFFGKNYSLKPLWLDPTSEPLTLLIFSVGLGLIQIITGMGIRFYTLLRQGETKSAFFDTGSWILILVGASLIAAGFALKISFLNVAGIALAAVGAITIVLMKGREKKNPVSRFFSGVLGLYDITSLVSDILSYSRLMALGLSTGVIASVVNMMAALTGGGVWGIVVFLVVFIAGHSLNFAINMLGAYVHTNRLQYVEFFSKFYDGGGKAFTPLKFNTKYYEFSERKD